MSTDFFQQVREDVRDGVRAPDLDAIHRAGKRRKRTRGIAAVAAVAAVVLVTGGTITTLQHHQAALPASTEKHGPIAGTPIQLTASMTVSQLQPITRTLTYAVVQTKPGAYAIARTTDAGQRWSAWSLPTETQNALVKQFVRNDVFLGTGIASDQDLPIVLDDQTVLLGGYLSRDGGQSWTQVTGGVKDTRAQYPPSYLGKDIDWIPAGWLVAWHMADDSAALSAIDPSTGLWHHLVNTPAKIVVNAQFSTDGSLWGTFADKALSFSTSTGHDAAISTLAVSRDRGRSWTAYQVPNGQGRPFDAPVSTDGVHAYAQLDKNVPGSGEVVSAGVMVTDNGGKTWTKRSAAPALPFGGIPLPGGAIIGLPTIGSNCLHEGAAIVLAVTRDGGQTCSLLPQTTNFGRFGRNADGFFLLTDKTQYPTDFRISEDGLNWTPVTEPPVGK